MLDEKDEHLQDTGLDDIDIVLDDDDFDIDFDFDLEDENFELFQQEDEDEYNDISDRILKLSDRLSEDIIFHNIEEQMNARMQPYAKRFNYVSLFKKKINSVNPNSVIYNKNYISDSADKLKELVLSLMEEKYSVSIGNESDFYFYPEFLDDLENLYEFVFVRHFSNLVNYFLFMIRKMRTQILTRFGAEMQSEENSGDIFVTTLRKKFKNEEDVIILHFLSEIIDFIINSMDSAYDLYTDIANLDPFETVSQHILKMLENYGNGIVFKNDKSAYEKYFAPLEFQEIRNELMNEIKMRYLENCTLNEDALRIIGEEGEENE